MESHYPIAVIAKENYILEILFDNKEKKLFDVKPYLEDDYFSPLKNVNCFYSVRTNELTVEWDGEIDICPDELYFNSVAI